MPSPSLSRNFFTATRFQCRCMVQPPQKMIRYPLPTCPMRGRRIRSADGMGSRVCEFRSKPEDVQYDDVPEFDPFLTPEHPFGGPDDPHYGPPMTARIWPILPWFTK
ncbi:uncharacterized protein BKCO1_6400010 [Diplodia corticola]|uniref:Uncharacterized protein n=1 Tax=Diplodia corticola TaxID=236234 RepID=A0A1J9QQD2_9PEZI|nr:uncharacterized protein BKCO1_6400010 [Diplodia corticola]OJD30234.1 hypothetical protein BKCO1_6400010 [Diplodia corticola]